MLSFEVTVQHGSIPRTSRSRESECGSQLPLDGSHVIEEEGEERGRDQILDENCQNSRLQ